MSKLFDNNLICIDPGLNNHTGIAVFYPGKKSPVKTDIVKLAKASLHSWDDQIFHTAIGVRAFAKNCGQALIEIPELWGSFKSQTSAQSGSLFKLSILCGAISQELRGQGTIVNFVFAKEWKGQLKKEMVDDRIFNSLGEKYPEHISDAVGIGLWRRGIL